jgi:RNA polymerase sigma-70 factor (ECF subfamily)
MIEKERTRESDENLLRLAAGGDEHAFEDLVSRYQQAVFNTIYRYAGNSEDIQDLAQEIFVKVWRNAAKFKGRSKFSTWLYRIVINHCLNYRRKNRQRHVSLDELTARGDLPEPLIAEPDWERRRKAGLVRRAVDELPERQRMALILAQFDGRSYREIADIMKVSVPSVESLIFRARRALRNKLTEVL